MPDPAPGTLAGRLRVAVGWLTEAEALLHRQALRSDLQGLASVRNEQAASALCDALAELRSIERAVAEREELRDVPLSHGEGG